MGFRRCIRDNERQGTVMGKYDSGKVTVCTINPLPHEIFRCNITSVIFKLILRNNILGTSCKNVLKRVPQNSLIISQHWFRLWLGAVKHQTSTWSNVDADLYSYIASLCCNEYGSEIGTYSRKTTKWSAPRNTCHANKRHALLYIHKIRMNFRGGISLKCSLSL